MCTLSIGVKPVASCVNPRASPKCHPIRALPRSDIRSKPTRTWAHYWLEVSRPTQTAVPRTNPKAWHQHQPTECHQTCKLGYPMQDGCTDPPCEPSTLHQGASYPQVCYALHCPLACLPSTQPRDASYLTLSPTTTTPPERPPAAWRDDQGRCWADLAEVVPRDHLRPKTTAETRIHLRSSREHSPTMVSLSCCLRWLRQTS